MESKLFIATKALVECGGKVLILRESGSYQDGTNAGGFDVPGGRLKPGERFDEALKREVLEETGLEVRVGKPIAVNEWRPIVRGERWQIVGIFFECHASITDVRLSPDHDAYEWISPVDYHTYPLIDNLKPVFDQYVRAEKKI